MAISPPPPQAPAPPAGLPAKALRAALRFGSPRRLAATGAFAAELLRTIRRRRREARLTVAVDIDSLYETLTGVGWYLVEILRELAGRDDLALRLYGQSLAPPGAAGAPEPATLLPAGPAIEHVTYAAPDGLVVPPWRADQLLRRAAPLLMAADGNRVLFGPNYLLPPLFRFAGGARVVTVHDLVVRRLPWAVRPDTAQALAERLERTLLDADLLLTPSRAVAAELAATGVAPARVRPIHHGPGHRPPATVAAAASPPAGTPARYGLFVGTIEPRKNLGTLLAAWRELHRQAQGAGAAAAGELAADGPPPALVVCGAPGWRSGALRQAVTDAVREGWLHYFGYVGEAELAALYQGALVLAQPSLYEGFGLPLVEALAAGVPLVVSDLPVFHEVAGDAALYAPPDRPDVWAARLRDALAPGEPRRDLIRRARRRGAQFSWHAAADATADAWREAAGDAGLPMAATAVPQSQAAGDAGLAAPGAAAGERR